MSDIQDTKSAILLPSARVSIFARDPEIRAAAETIKSDWRFARVAIDIQDGDVAMATELYATQASPDLIFVETLEIGEGFPKKLEVLAGNCSENTAAVVIGPVNDVYLYRQLIDIGVSDYLVRPLTAEVLADVMIKILIERLGAPGSKLIAFMGSKGGVGVSALAQVAALTVSEELKQKTILLDVAGGWSYLSVAMGSEALTSIHEVARAAVASDKDSFKRMIGTVNDKLSFLATGAEALLDDMITPDQLENILNRLMTTYPVVIVDLSSAPVNIRRSVIARAHEVVIVTSPVLPALRAARGLAQEVTSIRGGTENGLHLVINMKGAVSGNEVADADIVTAIKIKPDMTIAYQQKIFGTAEVQGKLISSVSGAKPLIDQMQDFLTTKLKIGKEGASSDGPDKSGAADQNSLIGGLLGKLKTK